MTDTIMGIDPGMNGGYAVLRGGDILACDRLPTFGVVVGRRTLNMVDGAWLARLADAHGVTSVAIEEAHGRKGDGAGGSFTFGGVWWSIYTHLRDYEPAVIPAKEWQKAILNPFRGLVSPFGPNGQPRTPREVGKAASILMARTLYPGADLQPGSLRGPHDGIADAIGIATYARTLAYPVSVKGHPPKTIKRPKRRRA